jgi:hypothetical protein
VARSAGRSIAPTPWWPIRRTPGTAPSFRWGLRGIEAWLPERGTEDDRHLGIFRWVVERTIAWLHQFRRLRIRDERRADIHQAFLTLGCAVICHRYLKASL